MNGTILSATDAIRRMPPMITMPVISTMMSP